MGNTIQEVVLASNRRTRFENVWWLLCQSMRCLFARRESTVVAQVVLYHPPNKAGDNVELDGQGLMSGPAPAVHAIMGSMLQQHMKNMLADGASGKAKLSSVPMPDYEAATDRPHTH